MLPCGNDLRLAYKPLAYIPISKERGFSQGKHGNGWPAIVGVQTNELPYWNHLRVQHAVVIVGLDSTYAYLNDPAFPEAPLQVSLGDFELAWLEQGEVYAVLTP